MTNMTYAEAIDVAITAIDQSNPEAVERLKALKVQLSKRGSKSGKTKTQKENDVLMEYIMAVLEEANSFITLAEFKVDEHLAELSTQKMGALLSHLVKDGKVQKKVHKKKTMYAIEGVEFTPEVEEAEEVTE